MKKTLAAVLAAAMALSTASVAFATDHSAEVILDGVVNDVDAKTDVEYGEEEKFVIDNLNGWTAAELGQMIDDGVISLDVIMTEGSSKLTARPSISLVTVMTSEEAAAGQSVWTNKAPTIEFGGKTIIKPGAVVNGLPINKAGSITSTDIDKVVYPGSDEYAAAWKYVKDNFRAWYKTEDVTVSTQESVPQVKFEVAHTYGTGSTEVKMKFRATVRKSENGLNKGDTYTSDEVTFKAEYHELASYSEDMELTLTEVDDNNVKLDASDLYDEIGAEDFVIYFDDTAAFSAKLSSAQKDVNLYYTVDEISAVTDAYPDVDFEFIEFKGAPSFLNSGSMTFNAIGAKNTTVYTFDGETLTPLDTTFDSTYGTVTAKGIKKLTTFVVADQVLEVEEEEEEPTEEVTETPEVDESNPNTGAC